MERFLLFQPWCKSTHRHLHVSQQFNKASTNNDEVLLDLLDDAAQDVPHATDPRRDKSSNVPAPHLDESVQELRSSMPDLPLSPLMDPKMVSARERYRTPKPPPARPASALENKLSKSPYGTQPSPEILKKGF